MSRLDSALSLFAAAAVLTTTLAGCRDATMPTRPLAPRAPSRTELPASPVVNSLGDPGPGSCSDSECTLRGAIAFASTGATITFNVTGTIVLAQGELLIDKDLTIAGPGASQLQVDGANSSREFEIAAGATVSISGVTLQNGSVPDPTAPFGAGIRNFGTLTLTNSVVSHNGTTGEGGGIHNTGGVLTIVGSTISANFAGNGGGIMNAHGTAFITNSTISGNFGGLGGGMQNAGLMRIINSTIAGNSVGNQGGQGSGIANTGETVMINTIVANDPAGGNCFQPITTDGGFNIEDGTTCGFTAVTSHSNANPGLDPAGLLSNGGPTPTIGLLLGGLAVDLIPPGVNGCGTTIAIDQRGVARPFGSGCDVGAYELDFKGFLPPINNVRTTPIHPGKGVPIQFILGGDHGLAIFASGSPSSAQIACPLSDGSGDDVPTVTAGNSQLSYDPSTDTYTYVWKTDKAWAGTCRRLFVTFADGSVHRADFSFDR